MSDGVDEIMDDREIRMVGNNPQHLHSGLAYSEELHCFGMLTVHDPDTDMGSAYEFRTLLLNATSLDADPAKLRNATEAEITAIAQINSNNKLVRHAIEMYIVSAMRLIQASDLPGHFTFAISGYGSSGGAMSIEHRAEREYNERVTAYDLHIATNALVRRLLEDKNIKPKMIGR